MPYRCCLVFGMLLLINIQKKFCSGCCTADQVIVCYRKESLLTIEFEYPPLSSILDSSESLSFSGKRTESYCSVNSRALRRRNIVVLWKQQWFTVPSFGFRHRFLVKLYKILFHLRQLKRITAFYFSWEHDFILKVHLNKFSKINAV